VEYKIHLEKNREYKQKNKDILNQKAREYYYKNRQEQLKPNIERKTSIKFLSKRQ